MNKTTKWILGIVAGLILLAVLAFAALVASNMIGGSGWVMGSRSGRLWGGDEVRPWDNMPMHPRSGAMGTWTGFFSPFHLFFPALICLGILVLIGVAVVALVLNQKRPQQPAAAPSVPTVQVVAAPVSPAAVEAPPAPQVASTCSSCQRPVSKDWKLCPYCGTPITPAPE